MFLWTAGLLPEDRRDQCRVNRQSVEKKINQHSHYRVSGKATRQTPSLSLAQGSPALAVNAPIVRT